MNTLAKTLQFCCSFALFFTFVCQLFMPLLSMWLYAFISVFSSGTYGACVPQGQRVPIVSAGFNFFTILLLHLRTKSVVKPRVVLLGKSRLFQTLQDLLTYEGCRLGLVHASVLFLLGCKGSRSSHCCSGYRGSSRGPYFKYAEVVTDQFADHCPSKAADST